MSKEGENLLKYISQPIVQREPVGYNKKFLEKYIPNKSSFLSLEQKKELLVLGQVDPSQKPAGTYARDIYQ
ncbi:MAG: Fic family protein, partial [Pseudobdellovibrionaceae bacterium]